MYILLPVSVGEKHCTHTQSWYVLNSIKSRQELTSTRSNKVRKITAQRSAPKLCCGLRFRDDITSDFQVRLVFIA